jgi:hypothetical protein
MVLNRIEVVVLYTVLAGDYLTVSGRRVVLLGSMTVVRMPSPSSESSPEWHRILTAGETKKRVPA